MRLSLALFTVLILASPAASQSYSHNYESFFGKEDRIGLYSKAATERFTPAILKTLRNNTLLMDCGASVMPLLVDFIDLSGLSSSSNEMVSPKVLKANVSCLTTVRLLF